MRTLAVDYRLLPVGLVPAKGEPPRTLLNARLGAGDRLIAIIALTDLERLLRRPSSAEFAVEVTAFPLPTRGWLAGLVRTQCNVSVAEAETALDRLPLRLNNLTRGQAEDFAGASGARARRRQSVRDAAGSGGASDLRVGMAVPRPRTRVGEPLVML